MPCILKGCSYGLYVQVLTSIAPQAESAVGSLEQVILEQDAHLVSKGIAIRKHRNWFDSLLFRCLSEKLLSYMTSTWHMWMTVSQTTLSFTRFVLEILFFGLFLFSLLKYIFWFFPRPLKRLLRYSATKMFLDAQVQSCWLHFVIISLRRVGWKNWATKLLRTHWIR